MSGEEFVSEEHILISPWIYNDAFLEAIDLGYPNSISPSRIRIILQLIDRAEVKHLSLGSFWS